MPRWPAACTCAHCDLALCADRDSASTAIRSAARRRYRAV